jgi:hypothetical protein
MSLRHFQGAVTASLFALLAIPTVTRAQNCPDPDPITAGLNGALAHVRYLADDALEGREVGTAGAHCAGRYIAEQFRALGLEPGVPGGSYFQPFDVRKGAELGPRNRLAISNEAYVLGKDWMPLGFSASTVADAPLVHAGLGLNPTEEEDDHPAALDVAGKAMVVEWGAPASGPHGSGLQGDPHFKGTVAAGRQAAALLVLLPEDMELPSPDAEIRNALSIPVLAVAGSAAEAVRGAAERGEAVSLQTDVRPTTAEARNVVALLPGSDPLLRDELVLVGAHFDHLGMGGDGSLAPDAREVHNGADDNASGTAALIEIAGRMARGPRPSRSIVFLGFTGEEKGLWGSGHYVADPTVDLERAVAMINLDMVGRLEDGGVSVFGTGTAEEWERVLNEVNGDLSHPLTMGFSPDGYGPSDHASFYGAGIPVLHFFTNTHADYHRPSDDWERIDAEGIERIAEMSAHIALRLAGSTTSTAMALTPVQQERQAPAASSASSSRSGYGPYRGGDVIVEFDGKEIADIYAYTYALREKAPGDQVVVVVERDGARLSLTAVLSARR